MPKTKLGMVNATITKITTHHIVAETENGKIATFFKADMKFHIEKAKEGTSITGILFFHSNGNFIMKNVRLRTTNR